MYLRDIWPKCESPQFSRTKIQEVPSGRNNKKGQEEGEGIRNLTQRSYSTIPSRFDATGGCSRHVVSPTLCLSSTFFRTALALPRTNRRVPFHPCPFYILFVHFYTPLPIRARFTRRDEYSPRISNRPDPVSSPLL